MFSELLDSSWAVLSYIISIIVHTPYRLLSYRHHDTLIVGPADLDVTVKMRVRTRPWIHYVFPLSKQLADDDPLWPSDVIFIDQTQHSSNSKKSGRCSPGGQRIRVSKP